MAKNATYKVAFRRRLEGKTNYKKRLELVKSGLPRIAVRKSNKFVLVQIIKFGRAGDNVLAQANSRELEKFGWKASKKNLSAAFLTGLLAGLRAKKAGIEKAVLDIGFSTPVHGAKCFAALKGALESGLQIPADASALPPEERISGKHIEEFAKKLSEEEFKKRFSKYVKDKVDAKNFVSLFENTRKKILQEAK